MFSCPFTVGSCEYEVSERGGGMLVLVNPEMLVRWTDREDMTVLL